MRLNYSEIPEDKIVWACAYSFNDNEKSKALRKEPVRGRLIQGSSSYAWDKTFHELKNNGEIKKSSVNASSRQYFETYEEAREYYNSRVESQIQRLQWLIDNVKKDFI